MTPTKKSKLAAQQPNEGFELSDEDRATLEAMAQKYGLGNDIAEFFAQLMVDVFES